MSTQRPTMRCREPGGASRLQSLLLVRLVAEPGSLGVRPTLLWR